MFLKRLVIIKAGVVRVVHNKEIYSIGQSDINDVQTHISVCVLLCLELQRDF